MATVVTLAVGRNWASVVIHIHIDGQSLSALFWSRLKTPQPPVELLPHRLDCHITPRSLTIPGFGTYPRIGHHFTSAAVPTFAFATQP